MSFNDFPLMSMKRDLKKKCCKSDLFKVVGLALAVFGFISAALLIFKKCIKPRLSCCDDDCCDCDDDDYEYENDYDMDDFDECEDCEDDCEYLALSVSERLKCKMFKLEEKMARLKEQIEEAAESEENQNN